MLYVNDMCFTESVRNGSMSLSALTNYARGQLPFQTFQTQSTSQGGKARALSIILGSSVMTLKLRRVFLNQVVFHIHSCASICFIHSTKTGSRLPYYKSQSVYMYLLSAAKYAPNPTHIFCSILYQSSIRTWCCWHSACYPILGMQLYCRLSKQCHLHMFAMISFYPPSFALFHPLSRLWQQFYFSVEQPSD